MQGPSTPENSMCSYISLAGQVPASHPLGTMSEDIDAVYSCASLPSVPLDRLLKKLLLRILISLWPEPLLVEGIDYDLLYR